MILTQSSTLAVKPSSLAQKRELLENFMGGRSTKEKTRTEQHRLWAVGHQALKAPPKDGKKGRLPLALDLAPEKAAACHLDHFGIFLFLLIKLDAASRAVCCWLSCVQHLGWTFKMNESMIFHVHRNCCFWRISTLLGGNMGSLLDPPHLCAVPHHLPATGPQHHPQIPRSRLQTAQRGAEPNPSDPKSSGAPVPRFQALGSACPTHWHQHSSTASTAPSRYLPWEADGSAALESFSVPFQITLWKAQTPPRIFRDLNSQESNFFPFFPKWAWIGLKKTSSESPRKYQPKYRCTKTVRKQHTEN